MSEPNSSCKKCMFLIKDRDAYCHRCGEKNSKFNRGKFEEEWGLTYEAILAKGCGGHGHAIIKFVIDSTMVDGVFYCPQCGVNILTEK